MSLISIASLQVKVHRDKRQNLTQLGEILKSQELKGVDFVALPEMFNCPYRTCDFPVYAEEEGGESWQECSRLAARHQVYLSAGSMPERDREGRIYNTAYVFDREGKQIAKHRKAHLFDIHVTGGQSFRESDTLTAGDTTTVFDTEFCRMGLCVCYDFRFPDPVRIMAREGAEVIIVPAAFNMTTGPAHWETMFRQRAVDNQVYTVGTAPARDLSASYISWGHSIIVSPWGSVVMEMEEKSEARVTRIDLDEVKRMREELPLLAHQRQDLYEIKRLK